MQDRVAGRGGNPELELARVTLPDEFWDQGPKAVNAEIRRLIDQAQASADVPVDPIPRQGAGPHFSLGSDLKIALAPPIAIDADGNNTRPDPPAVAVSAAGGGRIGRATEPHAQPAIFRNLADYRIAIAGEPQTFAWGIVFGLGVRLDNAAAVARRKVEDRL